MCFMNLGGTNHSFYQPVDVLIIVIQMFYLLCFIVLFLNLGSVSIIMLFDLQKHLSHNLFLLCYLNVMHAFLTNGCAFFHNMFPL